MRSNSGPDTRARYRCISGGVGVKYLQNSHTGTDALPFFSLTLNFKKLLSKYYPKQVNTLGDHIRKKKLDLGLLQKEVAGKTVCMKRLLPIAKGNEPCPQYGSLPPSRQHALSGKIGDNDVVAASGAGRCDVSEWS
jgi:hypothetical protein